MIVITHKSNNIENNPDREFMEECARIDKHKPSTWIGTPMEIISMEYQELMKKPSKKELYHLATACLHAWRHM